MEEAKTTAQQKDVPASTLDPLRGVRGWLKFFVIISRYVSPAIFILQYLLAWIGFVELAKKYPGIIVTGLIETAVGGFFVWKWIQIAKALQAVRPGIIRKTKIWLKLSLGWVILSAPLAFLSGLDAQILLPSVIKGVISGLIGFSLWYSYFSVSKRVKATYFDWNS